MRLTSITLREHQMLLEARDHIVAALRDEMDKRPTLASNLNWVDKERWAVVIAANDWAQANGYGSIAPNDVRHLESLALGHVDYAMKLSLYVAERVMDFRLSA